MKSTTQKLNAFVNLSVVLTGFSSADLEGTGMLSSYFEVVNNELSPAFIEEMLTDFISIHISDYNNLSKEELLKFQEFWKSKLYRKQLDQIIQLWYLGEWIDTKENKDFIVSSDAYLEGLIWKAIDAHPMGGKQPGFATWGFKPTTL